MTKKHSTKKALLSSALALFLCFAMLIGTTFAWFTDSVTSANNIITSGNLDIELEYWDGDSWEDVSGKSDILTNTLWEPGVTEVAYLRVANAGTLALKYQLGINIVSETAGTNVAGDSFKLSDYIKFGVVELDSFATYTDRTAAVVAVANNADKISAGYTKASSMTAGQELYLALVVYMPETVGNEANYKTGTTAPQIDLGINVMATQVANEEDSFGSDYDNGAAFVTAPVERPATATDMNLKGANDVVISLPAEVINALPADVTEIGMAVSDPVIDTTTNTVTFDSVELVDQNGKKIDLEAINLGEVINVTLPLPETAPFAEGEEVMVYHDGVYVATATVDENGNISYDVAHLCEITVGTIEEPAVKGDTVEIANVAQLISFAQSVNAGNSYAGKTVVLTADIDLNNVAWTPIGNWDNAFEGTFDGNGKVIKNLYINDAEGEGVGFFGVTVKATLKDVTIENVNINAYSMVAGLVGAAYPATIENCHVTGDVNIVSEWAYVAGIAGYCYYGTQVTDCSTIANATGLIKSNTRNAVGGITAWLLEGNHNVTNCTVKNLDLVGWTNVGGITGFVHYNNTIADCTVENVTLTKTRADGNPGIGLIAGGWSYSAKNAITLKNNSISNATITGTHIAYAAYNELYGSEYGGATTTNFVLENNTTKNVTNNLVEVTKVTTAADLETALKAGGTVVLGKNIKVSSDIAISGANFVLDGNGYTISGTSNYAIFDITGGTATIKNVTFDGLEGGAVVRTVGAKFNADNVTVQNCKHTQQQGLFRLMGESTITNCTFKNNTCSMAITLNYDGANNDPQIVENCVFENNTCNSTAVLYYVKGAGATISNNSFIGNTVNCNSNGATVYMGFTENNVVTGNLFENNTVTDVTSSTRVSGGIFFGYETEFKNNAFINNKVSNASGDALGNNVCVSTYYTSIDLSGNYWGGSAPVADEDYFVQHKSDERVVIINDYLTTYTK